MNIFIKSIISLFLEIVFMLLLAMILLLVALPFESYFPKTGLLTEFSLLIVLFISSLYFIFSNTMYRGISTYILNFSLSVGSHQKWRIIISNTALLVVFLLFIFTAESKDFKILYYFLQVLLFIEFSCCFVPKISTRMSFFLLGIKMISGEGVK